MEPGIQLKDKESRIQHLKFGINSVESRNKDYLELP